MAIDRKIINDDFFFVMAAENTGSDVYLFLLFVNERNVNSSNNDRRKNCSWKNVHVHARRRRRRRRGRRRKRPEIGSGKTFTEKTQQQTTRTDILCAFDSLARVSLLRVQLGPAEEDEGRLGPGSSGAARFCPQNRHENVRIHPSTLRGNVCEAATKAGGGRNPTRGPLQGDHFSVFFFSLNVRRDPASLQTSSGVLP
ncbi:hypothetical protein JOB18_008700 [Solea senegalensis]|uniref:Uncharacterized protein n=1 Tax=Solea senegalensis TaxID=28829 RepID=A0AAV6R7M0_SOLSE|nr:hypothetical protein JOB18_008700 [Solea senegalensis]